MISSRKLCLRQDQVTLALLLVVEELASFSAAVLGKSDRLLEFPEFGKGHGVEIQIPIQW